jgi:tetratricopeptide (TPR) repeat protein
LKVNIMTKDNILFSIVGVLLGFIIGFMFANNTNQRALQPTATAAAMGQQNSQLPPDHPPINQAGAPGQQAGMVDAQAAVKLAKDQPDNLDAQMKAAQVLYQSQRFDEAIEYLKRANQLKPDAYDTIVILGNVTFDAGRYEEAEKWYTQALKIKADDVNVRTDLGLTFFFRTPPDIDRAIKEYKASLEIDPNHQQTLQNLTVAYTKKGDAAQAQATLEKLEKVAPTNTALAKLRSDIEALKSGKTQAAATQPAAAPGKYSKGFRTREAAAHA